MIELARAHLQCTENGTGNSCSVDDVSKEIIAAHNHHDNASASHLAALSLEPVKIMPRLGTRLSINSLRLDGSGLYNGSRSSVDFSSPAANKKNNNNNSENNNNDREKSKSKRRGSLRSIFYRLSTSSRNRHSFLTKSCNSLCADTLSNTTRGPHGKSHNSLDTLGGDAVEAHLLFDPLNRTYDDVQSMIGALVNGTPVLELPTEEYIESLERMAQQEETDKQVERAIITWLKVLELRSGLNEKTRLRCKLATLYLNRATKESDKEAAKMLSNVNHDIILTNNETWLHPLSSRLLSILLDQRLWSLALFVAKQLPTTSNSILASIHYEMAIIMNKNQKFDISDQHLKDCHQLLLLEEKESNDRDGEVDGDCDGDDPSIGIPLSAKILDLWNLLAFAYAERERYEEALDCFQSRYKHISSHTEIASFHYSKAITIYVPQGFLQKSLEEADVGLEELEKMECKNDIDNNLRQTQQSESKEDSSSTVRKEENQELIMPQVFTKLLQIKADVLCRLGDIDESLKYYEKIVCNMERRSLRHSADAANILYTMGRVCIHAKRFDDAMKYFTRELAVTKTVVGKYHLAVSRVLHELAKVAEKGLLDYERALQYYNETLSIETAVLKKCVTDTQTLPCCRNPQLKQQRRNMARVSASSNFKNHFQCCVKHANMMKDAKQQIVETKRCLGRIHYMHGDFDSALKTSFESTK